MRTRVSVSIPEGTTADQLAAVASLASAIAAARWDLLARSFGRMADGRAVISRPMAAILEGIGHQHRAAARERVELDQAPATAFGAAPAGPAAGPRPR